MLLVVTGFLSGCVSGRKPVANSIFNPEAIYGVPPEGLWVEDLVDLSKDPPVHTGKIFLIPGTVVAYDPEEVND